MDAKLVCAACALLLTASSAAGAADTSPFSDYATTKFLPASELSDRGCKLTCNGADFDKAHLVSEDDEPKTCVGVLKIFCKFNGTSGLGIAGSKCEGKTTFVKDVAICEGAFQNFARKGVTVPDGKLVKSTKAYGCLGTSIAISVNGSSNRTEGLQPADALSVEAALAGTQRSIEGRCDGLSLRFQAAKVVGGCGEHHGKDSKGIDRHQHSDVGVEPAMLDSGVSQTHEAHIKLPGARRSLAGHHNKHDNEHAEGKKHGGDDEDDSDDTDHHEGDKAHKKHTDRDAKHGDKDCQMSFDAAESKVQHLMHKSGVQWLPRELPSGSSFIEGPQGPDCKITCNGRPTWFGAFFPCFGELKVDCEGGRRSLPAHIAGSDLDKSASAANGAEFEFHGACKGYWSGALFKTCTGFSTAHIDVAQKDIWDFCSGKKAVRMGSAPGKGFYSSSACRGKNLFVVQKDEEQSL